MTKVHYGAGSGRSHQVTYTLDETRDLLCHRLFILDGVIAMPIAVAGFFCFPDLPRNSKAWYLSKDVSSVLS